MSDSTTTPGKGLRNHAWSIGTVVASVAFSALVSSFLSYEVTTRTNSDKVILDYKDKQIANFIDSTVQFNTFAAAFAYDLTETKAVNIQTQKELIENLNQQLVLSKQVEQLIKNKASLVSNYQTEIITMLDNVRATDDITKMSTFWSSASRLLVARNKLIPALRELI
jgi:hypothetical protein